MAHPPKKVKLPTELWQMGKGLYEPLNSTSKLLKLSNWLKSYLPMASTSNPSSDLETYPTTAEVGLFAPPLLSSRYPSIQMIKKSNNQIIHRPGKAPQKPGCSRRRGEGTLAFFVRVLD
jgi:hypothetical protein